MPPRDRCHRVEQHALPKRVVPDTTSRARPRGSCITCSRTIGAAEDDVGPAGIQSGKLAAGPRRRPAFAMCPTTRSSSSSRGELEVAQRDRVRGPDLAAATISARGRAIVPERADRHLERRGAALRGTNGAMDRANVAGGTTPSAPWGAPRSPSEEPARSCRMAPSFSAAGREHLTALADEQLGAILPPMSTSTRRRSKTGTACSTPRWIRRASSTPEMTSTSTPASSCALSDEVVAVLGLPHRARRDRVDRRRFALSATATQSRRGQRCRGRWRRARGASCRRDPSRGGPSRLLAREHVEATVRSPIRATTRWIELVPMSIAASVASR